MSYALISDPDTWQVMDCPQPMGSCPIPDLFQNPLMDLGLSSHSSVSDSATLLVMDWAAFLPLGSFPIPDSSKNPQTNLGFSLQNPLINLRLVTYLPTQILQPCWLWIGFPIPNSSKNTLHTNLGLISYSVISYSAAWQVMDWAVPQPMGCCPIPDSFQNTFPNSGLISFPNLGFSNHRPISRASFNAPDIYKQKGALYGYCVPKFGHTLLCRKLCSKEGEPEKPPRVCRFFVVFSTNMAIQGL